MIKQSKTVAVSVGLFILLGMMLFVFGIFFLKAISTKPAYTFSVAYDAPDRLVPGSQVFYRGVEVGRVQDVTLSDDYDKTLVAIGITKEKLKLERNVRVHIRLEGITGQRYVEIKPPVPPGEEPGIESVRTEMTGNIDVQDGPSYIEDGDIIAGSENMTWEKVQQQLNEIVEKRTIEKTLDSAQHAMHNLELASANVNEFVATAKPEVMTSIHHIKEASSKIGESVEGIQKTVHNIEPVFSNTLKDVSDGMDQFSKNTKNLDSTLTSVENAATQVNDTFTTVDDQLKSTQVVAKVAETSDMLTASAGKVNRALTEDNAKQTVRTFGCTAGRLNHILKQRFLLFRLMFGKPGNDYECQDEQQTTSTSHKI